MRSNSLAHRDRKPQLVFTFVLLTVLCWAVPTRAEVIYKNIYVYMTNQGTYNFNFKGNVVTFAMTLQQNACGYTITVVETPAADIGAEGQPVAPLQAGEAIGPNAQFFAGAQTMKSLSWNHCGQGLSYGGPWPTGTVQYLGVNFLVNGQHHYGWASVEFNVVLTFGPPKLVAVLTGYAYETTPGTAIIAGQTK